MKKTIQLIMQTGRVASTLCLLAGALVLFSPAAARAVNGTWDKTKNGNWSDSANWLGGNIADGAGSTVNGQSLGTGATRIITLDSSRTNGNLFMDSNGTGRIYRFSDPTGTNTLTLKRATIPEVFVLNGQLEMYVVLDGTAGVRFTGQNSGGTPTMYLYATNIYSGNTEIASEGPLRIGVGVVDAIPHGSGKGNVVLVTTGGHGYGNLDIRESDITINGLSGAGGTVSASVSVNTGTSTLTVGDADATATFSGVILDGSRAVALTKIGTGTQTLSGANTYSGATTVNNGTLAVSGSIGGGFPPSVVMVNGGTFGGTGVSYGPVVVGAGGSIGAGAGPGTLTLWDGLDLSAGGTNVWELNANSDSNPGTDYDVINLAAGTLDLTDANLSIRLLAGVNVSDPFWMSSHSWNIITAVGGSGASKFQTIQVVGSSPAGTFTNSNDGNNIVLTFTPGAAPAVVLRPKMTSVVPTSPTSVTVNYTNTIAGTNYVVQYRTNLNTTNWTSLSPVPAAGTTSFTTDTPAAGSQQRFYRVFYVTQ